MMVAVDVEAVLEHGGHSGCIRPQICTVLHRCIVEIEVELRIQHTVPQVAGDEVGRTVGLPNLVEALAALVLLLQLLGEGAPVEKVDVLRGVVPESIDAKVRHPHQSRVRHGLHHLGAAQVQGGQMRVKPGGQAVIVPTFGIQAAVREVERGRPVAVLLVHGVIQVHVVGYVVQKDIQVAPMGDVQQLVQLLGAGHAAV